MAFGPGMVKGKPVPANQDGEEKAALPGRRLSSDRRSLTSAQLSQRSSHFHSPKDADTWLGHIGINLITLVEDIVSSQMRVKLPALPFKAAFQAYIKQFISVTGALRLSGVVNCFPVWE